MIPAPNAIGELPPGMHLALSQRSKWSLPRRRRLFEGLQRAMQNLHAAGVRRVFIDGSFVTTKADPNDIDGCWEWTEEVHLDLLDPVLLDFAQARRAMRDKYGVDFFLATWVEAGSGLTFLDFFQRNRADDPKGIVQLALEEMS